MCDICGCGEPGSYKIRKAGLDDPVEGGFEHSHPHGYDQGHIHDHNHSHHHPYSDDHDHNHSHNEDIIPGEMATGKRIINLGKDILEKNNLMAERNRGFFEAKEVFCINMVSSPGSGKTTLLEKTIVKLKDKFPVYVIEGDQQSMLDADRIAKLGIPVVQINTGLGCHLDANMVNKALKSFEIKSHSLLFIENVGNLVCPALFDLGETSRVLVMSVTEGDDKPVKYSAMFRSSHLCLINKTDLLPYVDFQMDSAVNNAAVMNPSLEFFKISAKTGEGMDLWFAWIIHNVSKINP
ncbi:MAG: hydrogenase nickel incorporation protein HypB [Bacteroidales bacterium]|jgi:hydrogenase nickel incorporation protein HypB|nr:hydrogenase nickel incorporation protein HypB [Bacteroidales bacterium]